MSNPTVDHSWAHNAWKCAMGRYWQHAFRIPQPYALEQFDLDDYVQRLRGYAETSEAILAIHHNTYR